MSTRIGDFLRQTRELKESGKGFYSLSAVAKRAGISHSYLSQLETGQVEQPLPGILKKLALALRQPYEDLMCAAGYLPQEKTKPKTIEIPILGECPADKFNLAIEEVYEDTIEMNFDLIKDKSAFGLKVKGDCLRDTGIYDGDIVIVSPGATHKNGDIVVARIGDECTMKKYYINKGLIVLRPCNHDVDLIILDPKDKTVEIVGKVIKAIKNF
ncbi:MAG: S24 family peptidase [Candidatus Omnitrophota bacterium]